jgi:hypothetical protein
MYTYEGLQSSSLTPFCLLITPTLDTTYDTLVTVNVPLI